MSSSKEKEIVHDGFIKRIDGDVLCVSIIAKSGCASCQLKGNCNLSDMEEKEIYAEKNRSDYFVGQQVRIRMKESAGLKAVFFAYILPFLFMLAVMIVTSAITPDEGIIGIAAIVSLIPYYIVLYLFKNKIKKNFKYAVEPLK